ncbi:MAG: amidase [Chloroflexi bacterium]|nr:MAG: amidase [Chloroflexota bacterium]
MPSELWQLSAAEMAARVRTREVSARELIDAHLERIASVNPDLNAITIVLESEAQEAADAADAAIARGEPIGPLHGVPMTVKENIDLRGSATTSGVRANAGQIAQRDAPHIQQLRAAGAIPIGRTNMPDDGMRWHTESQLYGHTRNPWDAARTPGGSSGGDAAALAAGCAPLGMGNDIGGSLRCPSHCCGTVALRPSFARVCRSNEFGDPNAQYLAAQLMAVHGPMARHVEDLRLAITHMMGPDLRDPRHITAPFEGPALPRRVALVPEPEGGSTDPTVAAGVRAAGHALADAGYEVDERQPPSLAEAADRYWQFLLTDLNLAFVEKVRAHAIPDAARVLDLLTANTTLLDLPGYQRVLGRRAGIRLEWSKFQAEWPLVVGPVFTVPPWPVGWDVESLETNAAFQESLRFVVTVNFLGLPAVAMPVGLHDGLPQSVQVIGPSFREDACLEAAACVEERLEPITPIDPR